MKVKVFPEQLSRIGINHQISQASTLDASFQTFHNNQQARSQRICSKYHHKQSKSRTIIKQISKHLPSSSQPPQFSLHKISKSHSANKIKSSIPLSVSASSYRNNVSRKLCCTRKNLGNIQKVIQHIRFFSQPRPDRKVGATVVTLHNVLESLLEVALFDFYER